MPRFNPIHLAIQGQHPVPSVGATGILRLEDLPQPGCSVADALLQFLLDAGEDDGHWIITITSTAEIHYELTAEGAKYLRGDGGD